MTPLRQVYELVFNELLEGKFQVKVIDPIYTPMPISEYIKEPSDALTHARNVIMYEWYVDNNCYPIIKDLYPFILQPETPIDLAGCSFKEMVFTISPETERILYPDKFIKKKKK